MLKFDKRFTKRAVLYTGFPCNLECEFCYYAKNKVGWHTLEHCTNQADVFRHNYDNHYVDITGGEATIYPHILPLIRHCRNINLLPTIITHAQTLAKMERLKQFVEAGIEDFLCSVHALESDYDIMTGVQGGWPRLVKAIENINQCNVPYRANCVITEVNYKQLQSVAKFLKDHNCRMVNYIFINIFEAQRDAAHLQVSYSQLEPHLHDALNYCDEVGLTGRVRYVPFCFMKGHESKNCNFIQLPYDFYEWDYKSWMSTQSGSPDVPKVADQEYQNYSEASAYRHLADRISRHNYTYASSCQNCKYRNICDGLNTRYVEKYGVKELKPEPGEVIQWPDHFLEAGPLY